jgi:hypothetical protein
MVAEKQNALRRTGKSWKGNLGKCETSVVNIWMEPIKVGKSLTNLTTLMLLFECPEMAATEKDPTNVYLPQCPTEPRIQHHASISSLISARAVCHRCAFAQAVSNAVKAKAMSTGLKDGGFHHTVGKFLQKT